MKIIEEVRNKLTVLKSRSGILSMLNANIINRAISMISSMLITRILSQTDYGIWSYTLNIYLYLSMITGLGLISGAMQFGTENRGEGRAYAFYKYCLSRGWVIDTLLVVITAVIVVFAELPIREAKPFVILILPFLLLEYTFSIARSVLRAKNRINEYARLLNVNSISLTVGTCVGAFLGISGVLIGRYLAQIISIIFSLHYIVNDAKEIKEANSLDRKERQQLWHYSIFTGASSAMNTIVYLLDVSLIAALIKDSTQIAVYKVGTLIPNALSFIPSSIIVAVLPNIIYHRMDITWVRQNTRKIYTGLFACNFCICGFAILLAPYIITIVSGSKYLNSVPVFRILTMGYFFSGTFRSLSVNLLAAFRRVHYGLFISIVSCTTDIIFNYLFITKIGAIGAAYSTLLVDVVTATLSFGYASFLLRKGTINETSG